MKWVFCLNDEGLKTHLFPLVKNAILSAKRYTLLEPVCLFDGKNKEFLNFLEKNRIEIHICEIPFKSFLNEKISDIKHILNKNKFKNFSEGAFLRYEICKYISDKYCLYTDVDILFTENFNIPKDKPKYLSMCRESQNTLEFNSGVILYNVSNFSNIYDSFINFCKKEVELWSLGEYDQYAINLFCNENIEELNMFYNWRPELGIKDNVGIIHYQRLKPFQSFKKEFESLRDSKEYKYYEKYYENFIINNK